MHKEYWSRMGPPIIAETPEQLWDMCKGYFEWVHENPLMESKVAQAKGLPTLIEIPKMRAMTIQGMCLFLNIDESTWYDWRKNRDDLSKIISHAENIIRTQKFEGAAAEFLNANIIARDLGLVDRNASEIEVHVDPLTEEQQAERVKELVPQIAPILIAMGWTPPSGDNEQP